MIFDYEKLVQLMLPTFLRRAVLIELLKMLVKPLATMHTAFLAWYENARYKANANASVISLVHHISREFGTVATIGELDGKPTDFLVSVQGLVDEARIRKLIDSYKLAGKSYVFESSEIEFACEFANWTCENYDEATTVEFVDYVCEIDRVVTIGFSYDLEGSNFGLVATASRPVHSTLNITGMIYGIAPGGSHFEAGSFYLSIEAGNQRGETGVGIYTQTGASYYLDYLVVDPVTDEFYDYGIIN